jgi:hypothetical protein
MPKPSANKPKKNTRKKGRPLSRANNPRSSSIPSRKDGSDETSLEALTAEDAEIIEAMQMQQQALTQKQVVPLADNLSYPSLEEFVTDHLQQFLAYLTGGVHVHVAAGIYGLPQSTIGQWMAEGKRDFEARIDSDQAKLYSGVHRAIAQRRAVAEMEVSERFPMEYLRKGNATHFGDEWKDMKELVWGDKLGVLQKPDGQTVIGTQVVLTANTIDDVMSIMKQYNLGAFATSEAQTKTIDATPESAAIEHVVQNRDAIVSVERPTAVQSFDLEAIRRMK